MLREGGLIVVASPYTWRPEYTAVEEWLGGFLKVVNMLGSYSKRVLQDAENHFTVDGLKEALSPELELLQELKVNFKNSSRQ